MTELNKWCWFVLQAMLLFIYSNIIFCNSWYYSPMSSLTFTKNCRSFCCWSAIQPFAPHLHSLNHILLHEHKFLHLFLGNWVLFISDCLQFVKILFNSNFVLSHNCISSHSFMLSSNLRNYGGFFYHPNITHIPSSMEHKKDPIKIPLISFNFPFSYNYD